MPLYYFSVDGVRLDEGCELSNDKSALGFARKLLRQAIVQKLAHPAELITLTVNHESGRWVGSVKSDQTVH